MPAEFPTDLPGADLVNQGLSDLSNHLTSDCSLLLLIVGPRLRRLGIDIPERPSAQPFEHQLYSRLEDRLGNDAHSHYNSLLRRIDSFAHALERQKHP
jgi:hypothetical protein